jgi:alpha-D-ribose 1-methylphosphonate 5-triphosphate synthase subunit PhnG
MPETPPDPAPDPAIAARQHWMAVLARASETQLRACLAGLPPLPDYVTLRGPEAGLVMLRGRAGGQGRRFNMGEMTVTRCAVRAEGGQVGHAYVAGRDAAQAELAARLDAALQDPATHDALHRAVIAPLAASQAAAREATREKAAATRVQFFTMATMRSSS